MFVLIDIIVIAGILSGLAGLITTGIDIRSDLRGRWIDFKGGKENED